jgi:hypothetical protein
MSDIDCSDLKSANEAMHGEIKELRAGIERLTNALKEMYVTDIGLRAEVERLRAPVAWAVARWEAEVKDRPLQNIHRRTLDDTWRQVIRHFEGDDRALCGPSHDELLEGK